MRYKKILKVIKDNFDFWVEPEYKHTVLFQQHTSMTQQEMDLLIKCFGKPKEN